MAATITWTGHGQVTSADETGTPPTGWLTAKLESGGGTPSAVVADGSIEGTGAVTTTSNNKRMVLYFDIGGGNELDFTTGATGSGTAVTGEMVYIWGNMISAALLEIQTVGGFGIYLGSAAPSTSVHDLWYFYGSDNYGGGFKRMVLDPNETPSVSAGTIDLGAIRYFGVFADTTNTARFDNLISDSIWVGEGLTVTGTSTTDALIADLIADEATNRYGIVTSLNDSNTAVELNGKLVLGDVTAATNSTLTDTAASIFVSEPLYYDGTSVTNSVPIDFFTISCVGGTGTNSIEIGKLVGSDSGRSGWSITGNDTYDVGFDMNDGNVDTSKWYGCTFSQLTGVIVGSTDTAHLMYNCTFSECEQFDPEGGMLLRNNSFVNTVSTTGALLWNASMDVQGCNFLANTIGEGIEHDTIISVLAGTCDAVGTATQLLDTGNFATGVSVGDYAYNETTNEFAKVTVIVDDDELTTETLSAGVWGNTDAYSISPAITYTNMIFAGNTSDVTNSATGSDALFVSKAGTSDPTTSTGNAEFIGAVTISFEAIDSTATAISGVQVSAYLVSDDSEVILQDTNGSGIASGSFTGSTPAEIYYKYRKASAGDDKYVNLSGLATIESSTGVSVKRSMEIDTNNNS